MEQRKRASRYPLSGRGIGSSGSKSDRGQGSAESSEDSSVKMIENFFRVRISISYLVDLQ